MPNETYPEILIISNRYDFASDYITSDLYECGVPYLRLNKNDLAELSIFMDPVNQSILVNKNEKEYRITAERLRSVFFRAPTFLRETSRLLSPEEELSRTQWQSFIRALMIFDNCKWVNHPSLTYYAETKPVQLFQANKVGFLVPKTGITNDHRYLNKVIGPSDEKVVVKSIDTVYMHIGSKKAFVYTNFININDFVNSNLVTAPVILQKALHPKIDIRVTVVELEIFAVEILEHDVGIKEDWRLRKGTVTYKPIRLPKDIEEKCITLVSNLGLKFGAIDLARVDSEYYFIEINPTGEWAWLVENAGLRIDKAISRCLING